MKGWGKSKIKMSLLQKGINETAIENALREIDSDNYIRKAKQLLLKKQKTIKEPDPYKKKMKLANFLVSKGYDANLAFELLKNI